MLSTSLTFLVEYFNYYKYETILDQSKDSLHAKQMLHQQASLTCLHKQDKNILVLVTHGYSLL